MRRHPQYGIDLLSSSKYSEAFNDIILYHHERYDGAGYINGLKGCLIPRYARIVSICDAFDAMLSFRSYRKQLSLQQAQDELCRNKDKQFDGLYVDPFLELTQHIYEYRKDRDTLCEMIPTSEVDSMPSLLDIADQLKEIGILFLDRHEKIYYCNQYAAQKRNKEKYELCGQSFYDLQQDC